MIKAVIDTNVPVSAFWTKNRLSPAEFCDLPGI